LRGEDHKEDVEELAGVLLPPQADRDNSEPGAQPSDGY